MTIYIFLKYLGFHQDTSPEHYELSTVFEKLVSQIIEIVGHRFYDRVMSITQVNLTSS